MSNRTFDMCMDGGTFSITELESSEAYCIDRRIGTKSFGKTFVGYPRNYVDFISDVVILNKLRLQLIGCLNNDHYNNIRIIAINLLEQNIKELTTQR
ncbi:hypothetical protein [Alishewanella phage vB_AspM_Slickus01]|nr:hypothetical protein [Alishewanella phage vB_AspM_Slickus01]